MRTDNNSFVFAKNLFSVPFSFCASKYSMLSFLNWVRNEFNFSDFWDKSLYICEYYIGYSKLATFL